MWEVVQSKINRFLDLADRYVMTVMVASQSDYMRVEDSEHLAPFQRAELMETVYSFLAQIASSSWTPSGRKLGLPQPLRLRKQCQGMLQRVLLECSTPDSSSEGC